MNALSRDPAPAGAAAGRPEGGRPEGNRREGNRRDRKALFIVWTGYQRRVGSMEELLGFDVRWLPPPVSRAWAKPFGYLAQAWATARAVFGTRPDEVWVQSPPTFVPHLLVALRPFARRRYRIVADAHNGVVQSGWSRVPGTVWAMNRCDLVLVHNEEIVAEALAMGIRPELLSVLEDPPSTLPAGETPAAAIAAPYVLVPCSFGADEPIPILLEAAARAPEARFLVTGSRRKAEALGYLAKAPANVTFTDYLPLAEFERLLLEAPLVLGLTDVEGIQLSVANEALGAHRAILLSDTRILRAMFGEAALFAPNTAEGLAAGVREALARRPELEARSAALKATRQADWRAAAAKVTAALG
jgi:hypothetical protein